ncbi:MAG: peptidylprolyl isomerase [Dysgonamonadaceae bacterium]|jgi:peptidyl-prolyl cis-trans isomerase SurA|nr:peptidylprolyl isomerase [Dysgonamonadaceae bacterium]
MRKHLIILAVGFISMSIYAQGDDPVVMKVNGKDVKKSEFEYLYKKNNTGIALDEYVELFKNFKLKVAAAETQGIDTTTAFIKELKDNRDQLAKQYQKDLEVDESMLAGEYERLNEDIEISHVSIPIKIEKKVDAEGNEIKILAAQLLPADTLAAYKRALQIRKRLLKGENIEKIAAELEKTYTATNNPPVYLGWIPAMGILSDIEDVIYATKKGSVSQPFRFNNVYLMFKVLDKRPSAGEVKASHIMVGCLKDADSTTVETAQQKADEIYRKVTSGEDFATLAKELSDDKGSGQQGGMLGWFGKGRMVKEFEDVAFALKENGEISQPVRSQYGFHIIKLEDKRGIEPLEQKRNQIINFLGRSSKYHLLYKPGVDALKAKASFTVNENALNELYKLANTYQLSDSTFQAKANIEEVLFTVWGTAYNVGGFLSYAERNAASALSTDVLSDRYNDYVIDILKKEENKNLEAQYPEFKNLMQEYRDGFLSFEITQNEVWEKAPRDTTGLTDFFLANKDKYKWDEPRYKGYVILCKDKKTKKEAEKILKKSDPDTAIKLITEKFNADSVKYVKVEKKLFQRGNNPYIDEVIFKTGKAEVDNDYPVLLLTGKLLSNGPESYTDVGGLVISDYQNYLEERWIQKLRAEYPIEIFPEVLKTIN